MKIYWSMHGDDYNGWTLMAYSYDQKMEHISPIWSQRRTYNNLTELLLDIEKLQKDYEGK